jgi:primosomal replication protein N
MSFNKIILVGNLGRDPELRYTPQGTPVCSFSLATNERRKDRTTGENNDVTTWFRVTLWGRQAESISRAAGRFTLKDVFAWKSGLIVTAKRATRWKFTRLTCSLLVAAREMKAAQRPREQQPLRHLTRRWKRLR